MAKMFEKFLESINLNDSDDDFDEEEFDEFDEDYDEEPAKKRSFFKKKEEDDELDEPVEKVSPFRGRNNVVPMQSSSRKTMEVCLIKPSSVEDAREISDTLLSGRAVVLNLEGLHNEVAQRIIDFASGACYSIGGNLQKVSNYIFIVTPKTIELSGDFNDLMSGVSTGDLSSLTLNI